jgi:hypothetical protein
MKGIYTEWSGGESWYLAGAKYWVLRRLLSDPYQDPDTLWRQYCRDMFGPAWEEMFRFYGMFAQKHVCSGKYCERADFPRQEMLCFPPEDLALQRRWLERAIELTRDEAMIQKRLAAVMRYFRAHELFALAVGEPGRLHHRFRVVGKAKGINKEALAYYLNEEGHRLQDAIDYTRTQRTLPPDVSDDNFGLLASYINNTTRAKADIIQAIRQQALKDFDLAAADAAKARAIVERCKAILRDNVPAKHNPAKLAEFDEIMEKVLWVPRAPRLPELDGDLSDGVWKQAAELTGWTIRDTLARSRHETAGRLMRVGDRLVLGITCRQVGGIWADTPREVETGTRLWRESSVEFFFGLVPREGQEAEKAQYIVNAFGAFRGFGTAHHNREGAAVAVKLDPARGFYTIEAAFPLHAEGYDYRKEKALSFNLMRNVFTKKGWTAEEIIGWHPIFYTAQNAVSRALIFME